ncbi:MAG TPA: polysaccharide biosynthesis/export family protein [Bryobacteraceae bacterium]|jgi:polysaccharide export outer membrane protein|nr:polysaccharide biosynthesis/export family protein [Bryobacteraceae bacterium]
MIRRSVAAVVSLLVISSIGLAQSDSRSSLPTQLPSTYVLGPGDQIAIQLTPEGDEINGKLWRIDEAGDVVVPLAGTVHASGLTTRDLASVLAERLRVYFRGPQVIVSVAEMRSQPVSIVGAVNTPGVHQLLGHKTLIETLALAGGLRPDAGYRLKITRETEWGTIPLAGATTDKEGSFSVAEVGLKSLMDAANPAENIAIMPNDVITVPVAEMIYVIGDVKKSGGFVLGERRQMSVLQALALSEGLGPSARADEARILRANGTDSRTELPVNLKKILAGQTNDVEMQSNDILFVPVNGAKRLGVRALETMVSIGTGIAIYHP